MYPGLRFAVFKIKVKKRHLHQGNFERISQISKKITRIYTRKSIKKKFSSLFSKKMKILKFNFSTFSIFISLLQGNFGLSLRNLYGTDIFFKKVIFFLKSFFDLSAWKIAKKKYHFFYSNITLSPGFKIQILA